VCPSGNENRAACGRIAYVPQNIFLLDASIEQNIRWEFRAAVDRPRCSKLHDWHSSMNSSGRYRMVIRSGSANAELR